jgi:hypothetical protein
MHLPHDNSPNDLLTIFPPRCEAQRTLQGGYCELPGKVRFAGVLVCEGHARQLEAQDRRALLKGIALSLELCLRSIPLRKNKDLSILLRAQHALATQELAHALEDLRCATTQLEQQQLH